MERKGINKILKTIFEQTPRAAVNGIQHQQMPYQFVCQRVKAAPSHMINPTDIMVLQRTNGNQAVRQLLQMKMDEHNTLQPQEPEEEEEGIQAKSSLPVQQQAPEEKEEIKATLALSLQEAKQKNTGMPDSLKAGVENMSGLDMSDVRVHRSSNKPSKVNALAYTVERDIVFAPGQHAPHTYTGQELQAHEIAHVVQQSRYAIGGTLQREQASASLDANAQRIIDLSRGRGTRRRRARAVVRAIIAQYFSQHASKISRITYGGRSHDGLEITFDRAGGGARMTGTISVSREFIDDFTERNFARRVLQVRHEIEHVEQVRSGMHGPEHSDQREFLAFFHEATATELPGTGLMRPSMRVRLIDAALGYYYCLSSALQNTYSNERDGLIRRRAEEVSRMSRSAQTNIGPAPTMCRRASG